MARLNFDLFAMSHFCQDFIHFAIEQEVLYFGEFKTKAWPHGHAHKDIPLATGTATVLGKKDLDAPYYFNCGSW